MKIVSSQLRISMLAALIGLTACDRGNQGGDSTLTGSRPLAQSVTAVQRTNGQKVFMNLVQTYNAKMALESAGGAAPAAARAFAASAEGGRAVLEADVFSLVGDRLVVLHSGRGLSVITGLKKGENGQIISFEDAYQVPDEKALSHTPTLLYQWPETDLVVVIGTANTEEGSKNVARLVDVSRDGKGYFAEQTLVGQVVDHRLVTQGDEAVLYVASATDYNEKTRLQEGAIASYAVSPEGFAPVGSQKLDRAVASGEVMQIASTTINGEEKFLLTAPLATHWTIRRTGENFHWDLVQGGLMLLDVSDASGKLGQAYELPVAGAIAKRGFTDLVGHRLDVASQTQFEGSGAVAFQQAVVADSNYVEVISEDDAVERLKAFDAALAEVYAAALKAKKEKVEKEEEKALVTLTRDEKRALYGQSYKSLLEQANLETAYVKKEGRLVKLKMDFTDYITGPDAAANLRGGAQVQDVRFLDNLIQIAWVPASQVDPVTFYDRGDKDRQPRQVALVEFPSGFFNRILPVKAVNPGTQEEELFLIGYGVEPNAQGQNVPMTRMYRLEKRVDPRGETFFEKIEVAHQTFGDAQTHLEQRSQDRYVLFNYNEKTGKANLLIQANRYADDVTQKGGFFVTYDVAQTFENPFAAGGADRSVVTVSPFVAGNEVDQVFRMFYTPATSAEWLAGADVITSLGKSATFFAGPKDPRNPFAKVLTTIEMIKDVVWFETVGAGDQEHGVQFIQKTYNDKGTGYEARLVALDAVDASKYEALHVGPFVPGSYVTQYKTKAGELVLVTSRSKSIKTQDGKYKQETTVYLTALSTGQDEEGKTVLVAKSSTELKYTDAYGVSAEVAALTDAGDALVVVSPSNAARTFVAYSKGQFRQVAIEDGASQDWLNDGETSVVELAGRLYVLVTKDVTLKDVDGSEVQVADAGNYSYKFVQKFVLPLETSGEDFILGRAVNVPGTPVALVEGKYLLTDDTYAASLNTVNKQKKDANGDAVVDGEGKVQFVKVVSDIKAARQYSLVAVGNGSARYNGGRYDLPAMADYGIRPMHMARTSIMPYPRYSSAQVHVVNGNQFVFTTNKNGQYFMVTLQARAEAALVELSQMNLSDLLSESAGAYGWSVLKPLERKDRDDLVVLEAAGRPTLVLASLDKHGVPSVVELERTNGDYAESKRAVVPSSQTYSIEKHQVHFSDARGMLEVVDTGISEVRQYKVLD